MYPDEFSPDITVISTAPPRLARQTKYVNGYWCPKKKVTPVKTKLSSASPEFYPSYQEYQRVENYLRELAQTQPRQPCVYTLTSKLVWESFPLHQVLRKGEYPEWVLHNSIQTPEDHFVPANTTWGFSLIQAFFNLQLPITSRAVIKKSFEVVDFHE